MPTNDTLKGESFTDGLIITIFDDSGPLNIYNSSPLTEEEAFNLAIKSLTALSSDIPRIGEIRSYGPIPTPRDTFSTIGFILTLKAVDSTDIRITQFGRIVVFWVITRSSSSVKYVGVLKQMLRRTIRSYKILTDRDLQEKGFLEKIDEKLQIVETGVDSYYLSDRETFEPFLELALIPANVPVMLVDKPNKQISSRYIVMPTYATESFISRLYTSRRTLLDQLHRQGQTIITVTHEATVACHAKRIIRMRDGRVHSDLPAQQDRSVSAGAEYSPEESER